MSIFSARLRIALTFAIGISPFFNNAEARIRMRKVKEAPRVCRALAEDKLLSRNEKRVLATERHSLVFENSIANQSNIPEDSQAAEGFDGEVSLVRDRGEKICRWRMSELESFAPSSQFRFYIDEFRETLYSYFKNPDESVFVITTPLATCSFEQRATLAQFDPPNCENFKKRTSSKKKVRRRTASLANISN